jgi:hypothetical protein
MSVLQKTDGTGQLSRAYKVRTGGAMKVALARSVAVDRRRADAVTSAALQLTERDVGIQVRRASGGQIARE